MHREVLKMTFQFRTKQQQLVSSLLRALMLEKATLSSKIKTSHGMYSQGG